jgi:hypothetical protein
MHSRTLLVGAAIAATTLALTAAPAAAQAAPGPAVLHVGQIAAQDIPSASYCEPDTLVEPDVAVSPINPDVAVAATHDCRFPDGGAVDISYSWTHNGGATWHHAAMPGITKAAGGTWDRASDPVIAFGPDGSVYISVLDISLDCPSAVSVSRSTDGGRTFGPPVLAHYSDDCNYSDDKNFIIADNGAHSPYRGRLYQFWTPFLGGSFGTGSQQVLRWSDDHGRTWSDTVALTPPGIYTQNSQPMIQPDGTLIDTYLNYGAAGGGEGPESRIGNDTEAALAPADEAPADRIAARVSHDGGQTWSAESTVTTQAGEGPLGIRCCLPSAAADPVTGKLYAAWISPDSDAVVLETSTNGTAWSAPIGVTPATPGHDYVNVDVAAYGGRAFVSTGIRDLGVEDGRYIQQELLASTGGAQFAAPISVGPLSDLDYAAEAGGKFPGDYIGTAATRGRVYAAWCRSSQPADPNAVYHQVLWGATLRT